MLDGYECLHGADWAAVEILYHFFSYLKAEVYPLQQPQLPASSHHNQTRPHNSLDITPGRSIPPRSEEAQGEVSNEGVGQQSHYAEGNVLVELGLEFLESVVTRSCLRQVGDAGKGRIAVDLTKTDGAAEGVEACYVMRLVIRRKIVCRRQERSRRCVAERWQTMEYERRSRLGQGRKVEEVVLEVCICR